MTRPAGGSVEAEVFAYRVRTAIASLITYKVPLTSSGRLHAGDVSAFTTDWVRPRTPGRLPRDHQPFGGVGARAGRASRRGACRGAADAPGGDGCAGTWLVLQDTVPEPQQSPRA